MQLWPVTLTSEVGEPIERTLDAGTIEARAFQILRERLALGDFRVVGQHVAIEHINKNVQNATGVGGLGHESGVRGNWVKDENTGRGRRMRHAPGVPG